MKKSGFNFSLKNVIEIYDNEMNVTTGTIFNTQRKQMTKDMSVSFRKAMKTINACGQGFV